MNRIISILFLLLLSTQITKSQDLIVTNKLDTIRGRITKSTKNHVSISIQNNGFESHAKLPKSEIKSLTMSDFTVKKPNNSTLKGQDRWVIKAQGGISYLIGSTKSAKEIMQQQGISKADADSYYQNYVWGNHAKGSLGYQLVPNLGIGVCYRFFNTHSSYSGSFDPRDGIHTLYGKQEETVFNNYFGLSLFSEQRFLNEKFSVWSSVSFGQCFYRNEIVSSVLPTLVKGNTFAFDTELGCNYHLTKSFSIGFTSGAFFGTLKKIDVKSMMDENTIKLDKKYYENMSALDFSFNCAFDF